MNIEEIDKCLDNEYGVSYTELEKLHDFVVDRDREHQEQKDKVVNVLLKRISNLEFEVEEKDRRIDKAIDFLKENACIDEDVEYFCDDLRYDDCKKLLEILKGEDKE